MTAPPLEPGGVELPRQPTEKPSGRRRRGSDDLAVEALRWIRARWTLARDQHGQPVGLPERSGVALSVSGLLAAARRMFFESAEKSVSGEVASQIRALLEASLDDGAAVNVAIRWATTSCGRVVLDLGPGAGGFVVVDREGFTVAPNPPPGIFFSRPPHQLAMPTPQRGGTLHELTEFLPVGPEAPPQIAAWAWTIAGGEPVPIVAFFGPAGAGKSSATRALVALLDPARGSPRGMARDPETLALTATAARVVAFDNISSLGAEQSDVLCRLTTGDAIVARKLYSDSDLIVLESRLGVLLNGIDLASIRADLGERLLRLTLRPIEPRRTEAAIRAAFDAARPRLLGAILSTISAGMRAEVDGEVGLCRMADFTLKLARVCRAIGDDQPLEAYRAGVEDSATDALESDALVAPLRAYLSQLAPAAFEGSAEHLLAGLVAPAPRPPGWPTTPRALSDRLRRLAGPLRAAGFEIEPPEGATRGPDGLKARRWRLRAPDRHSTPDAPADAGPFPT